MKNNLLKGGKMKKNGNFYVLTFIAIVFCAGVITGEIYTAGRLGGAMKDIISQLQEQCIKK